MKKEWRDERKNKERIKILDRWKNEKKEKMKNWIEARKKEKERLNGRNKQTSKQKEKRKDWLNGRRNEEYLIDGRKREIKGWLDGRKRERKKRLTRWLKVGKDCLDGRRERKKVMKWLNRWQKKRNEVIEQITERNEMIEQMTQRRKGIKLLNRW